METILEEKEKLIHKLISDIYEEADHLQQKKSRYVLFDIIHSFIVIQTFCNIQKEEPPVLTIDTKQDDNDFIVVGDLHGDLLSLVSIFRKEGDPSTTKYLFLGDYVDRGRNCCDVIILLYAYKCLYPNNIHLIRGNHEFEEKNKFCGFKKECNKRVKYFKDEKIVMLGTAFYKKVTESFKYLPVCAILNDKIFCVHGGITDLINDKDQLMSIKKVGFEWRTFSDVNSIQIELLWNDPDEKVELFNESDRCLGRVFGKAALDEFLNKMGFDMVIRGHQVEACGYKWPFGESGGLLTVFSSVNHCGEGNEGAVAHVTKDGKVTPVKFDLIQNDSV